MISAGRTLAIMGKELRQLRRDRLTFGMIIGIPALQLLLFGYAINQDVRHLRAAVADGAGTQAARMLVADAEASQVIDVVARAEGTRELERLLRRGDVDVGLVLPRDLDRRLAEQGREGARAPAQLLVDASDPTVLATASGLRGLPAPGRGLGDPAAAPGGARPRGEANSRAGETFAIRPLYNPEKRSDVFIVPGLVGVILTLTMVLFTAVAIVRELERGNLELLITTPVGRTELMVGKIAPYVAIGLVQTTIILALGSWLFRVPLRGALTDFYLGALCFIAATLSFGLLVSTVARSQFQAFQLTMFFFLPSILLSGFMFPFDGMPRAARALAEVLPLTHFNRVARGVLLRGAGLHDVRGELWPMAAFFAITMSLAVLRFRKRLD